MRAISLAKTGDPQRSFDLLRQPTTRLRIVPWIQGMAIRSACSGEIERSALSGMNKEEMAQLPPKISPASSMYKVMNPSDIPNPPIPLVIWHPCG